MGSFQLLLQHLKQNTDALSITSINTLFRFIKIATALKRDIILVEASSALISDPPHILPPAIARFLGAGCSISPEEVADAHDIRTS